MLSFCYVSPNIKTENDYFHYFSNIFIIGPCQKKTPVKKAVNKITPAKLIKMLTLIIFQACNKRVL